MLPYGVKYGGISWKSNPSLWHHKYEKALTILTWWMWSHSWLDLDLWQVALTTVLVTVDLERITQYSQCVLPLDYVCLSTHVCIAYQSYWNLLLHHVHLFLYITIILKFLLVKIVFDLSFGCLRYHLLLLNPWSWNQWKC